MIVPVNEDRTVYVLVLGQSLMGNHNVIGELHSEEYFNDIFEMNTDGEWDKAYTPISYSESRLGYNKRLTTGKVSIEGSVFPFLSRRIIDSNKSRVDKVKVVNISRGGAWIRQWIKNAHEDVYNARDDDFFDYDRYIGISGLNRYKQLFERVLFVKKILNETKFAPNGFDFIIYHQGESDAHDDIPSDIYEPMLRKFLNDIYMIFKTKIHLCQTSYVYGEKKTYITDIQKKIADDTSYILHGVNTDLYDSTHRHDNLHFNQKGIDRFVKEMYSVLNGYRAYGIPFVKCGIPYKKITCGKR